jgi:hypothetical protein
MIDVELSREDYSPIPRNCDGRGVELFDARTDPQSILN